MGPIPKRSQISAEIPVVDAESSLITEMQKLDLTFNEARILVYLMTHGHSTANEVSRQTGIQRTETYNYLSALLSKGIVFSTFDRPQKFYSMPIEDVIDHLLQTKRNALEAFEGRTGECVEMLNFLVSNKVIRHDDKERYNVVMGRNAINTKVRRMLADAKEEVTALLSDRDLFHFYHAGIADQFGEIARRGVKVRFKTSCKNPDDYLEEKDSTVMLSTTQKELPTGFLVVDGEEMIVLLEEEEVKNAEACGFYTNSRSLVSVFKYLHEHVM